MFSPSELEDETGGCWRRNTGHETAVDLTRQSQEMFAGVPQVPKDPKMVVIISGLPADESSQVSSPGT